MIIDKKVLVNGNYKNHISMILKIYANTTMKN